MLLAKCPECAALALEGKHPTECAHAPQIPAAQDAEENLYYACPDRFIPESMIQFWELYQYEKEFGGAPPYQQRNNKFIEALACFENRLHDAYEAKEPDHGGGDSFKQLRDTWKKK